MEGVFVCLCEIFFIGTTRARVNKSSGFGSLSGQSTTRSGPDFFSLFVGRVACLWEDLRS